MTKSTITREQLIKKAQEQIEFCRHTKITGEGRAHVNQCAALFEIALAAMDSEPVELPLDYLQGHKDGLEWAAQLAEANHPETGDWLYDDPIDLAKAIRKGPDMPPAQPVPVVSAELLHTAASAIEDLLTTKDRTGAGVWFDLPFRLRSAANAQPALVVPDEIKHRIGGLDWGWEGEFNRGWNACRAAMLHAGNSPAKNGVAPAQSGNSPAIPDGYVLVSKEARKEILDEFDSIIDYGAEDSVDAWHRLLAAATQEVKP